MLFVSDRAFVVGRQRRSRRSSFTKSLQSEEPLSRGGSERGTILYYTLLYSTLLYSTLLYSTLLYSTLLYSTLLYYAMLCYAILYYTILYYTILYYTILYYTILYYTILYFSILQRTHIGPVLGLIWELLRPVNPMTLFSCFVGTLYRTVELQWRSTVLAYPKAQIYFLFG